MKDTNIVPVTVNTMLINNAFVSIFDALNGDDDDTRFEVNIIEQFVDQQNEKITALENVVEQLEAKHLEIIKDNIKKLNQLQEKLNDAAEVGMYQHYFATELLKQLPDSCLDLFNVGEDCFVMNLYPYADLITKHVLLSLEDKDSELQVIFAYEAMEELAGLWMATVMRQKIQVHDEMQYQMPALDQFELAVIQVMAKHSS